MAEGAYPEAILEGKNLKVVYEEEKGYSLRATDVFGIGDLIVEDEGISIVLTGPDSADRYCHVCLMPHAKMINCKGCKMWSACAGCARSTLRDHQSHCRIYADLPALAEKCRTDPNLLRFLLNVMLASAEVRRAPAQPADADAAARLARRALALKAFQCLQADADAYPPTWYRGMHLACSALIQLARKQLADLVQPDDAESTFAGYDVALLVQTAISINLTSFGLADKDAPGSNFGVGLFPILGILTHSCLPNTVFSSLDNGRMALRALRPIDAGDRITAAFVDIFQSRQQRRDDLMQTKHVVCECPRCDDEQYDVFPQDRFLDYPLCPKCKADVAFPESFLEEEEEGHGEDACTDDHGHGDHGHSHGDHSHSHGDHGHSHGDHGHSHGDHGHSHGDHGDHGHSHGDHGHSHGDHGHSHGDHGHSHGDHDDHGHSHGDHGHSHGDGGSCNHDHDGDMLRQDGRRVKSYACIGCEAKFDGAIVERPLRDCAQEMRSAQGFYHQRKFAEAARVFEHILRTYEKGKQIHATYFLVYSVYAPLVNCYRRMDQLPQSAAMLRSILDILDTNPAIAEHHPEKADFLWNLGQTYQMLYERSNDRTPKSAKMRYRQDAREAYSKAAAIRTVCFGADDASTAEALKAMNSV